jgi:chromosome segregation ATPase
VSDAAVLEAKIALPYAYAELGAYGQSLEGYETAVSQFDAEQGALKESIDAIRSGKLIEGLSARNPGEEMGWFWNLTELPEMPHAGHLTQVLAQHEFQEAFKNYRDLQFLGRNLVQWRDSLGAYRDMLAERKAAFAQKLPEAKSGAGTTSATLAELKRDRASLAAELARVERDGDVIAFADAKQDDLLQRLASVQAAMQVHAKDPEVARLADKVRLLSGALAWQLAQDYPARLWNTQKSLRDADAGLAQAEQREAALAAAQREEPLRFERFAKRIDALEAQLGGLIPRVAALTQEQQDAVQGIAVAELARAQQRLAEYQTQARFALAQLYDRANSVATNSKGAGDAPRR